MKRQYIYVDASVIGGCDDVEFAEASRALWRLFIKGTFTQVLSAHTLRELQDAPESVRSRLMEIPEAHQLLLLDTTEADTLADAYLAHGILGPGSRSDALHVALATIGRVDVLVSWKLQACCQSRQDVQCGESGAGLRLDRNSDPEGGGGG